MPWHDRFGGPRFGWGRVPNTPHLGGPEWSPWRNFDRGRGFGRGDRSAYDAPFRGAWQRAGHGPPQMRGYGWEYQGGYPHDAMISRTEARTGDDMTSWMAQRRGGGLPRGRERFGVDRWGGTLGRGYDREMLRRDRRIRYGMDYLRERWG